MIKPVYEDINVEYKDHMGSDLMVCDAARVSFNKESSWDIVDEEKVLKMSDEKLIKYLAEHNHWTPFSHPQIQFRMKVPFFVARQLDKHQIGATRNEVSRRYVDSDPTFYLPNEDKWRGRPLNKKQGSEEGVYIDLSPMYEETDDNFVHLPHEVVEVCLVTYKKMIEIGVAPEQARMVLPMNTMTEYFWTMSLATLARIASLRIKPDAQEETKQAAEKMFEIGKKYFPVSMKYLCK